MRLAAKASRSSAPATSIASRSRSASATARAAMPVEKAFELISASASLACSSTSAKSPFARSAMAGRSAWPSDPSIRTRGCSPALRRGDEAFGDLGPGARGRAREGVRKPDHGRPDDLLRRVRACPDQVVDDQCPVERARLLGGNGDLLAGADAGRHPVHGVPALEHTLDQGTRLAHPLERLGGELHRRALAGDRHDLLDREAPAVEDDARQPQTSAAVSTIVASFARSSSTVRAFPTTDVAKPH